MFLFCVTLTKKKTKKQKKKKKKKKKNHFFFILFFFITNSDPVSVCVVLYVIILIQILIRYNVKYLITACTRSLDFDLKNWKISLSWEGGDNPLPDPHPARELRSLAFVTFPLGAPPMRWPTVRHCMQDMLHRCQRYVEISGYVKDVGA